MLGTHLTYDELAHEVERLRRRNAELEFNRDLVNEEQERNSFLVNYLSDYIYTVKIENGKAVETTHGPGSLAVTGYSSEDYKAQPDLWHRMVYEEDREKVTEQARKALKGEEFPTILHRIVHREGSIKWVRNTTVILRNPDGHFYGYCGLINDVTRLKKAEQLAEIKNQQLIQADKMATIGILASGIAHEINNPNNFILLNTDILKRMWEDALPVLKEYYKNHGDFVLAGMSYKQSAAQFSKLITGMEKGARRIQKIVSSLKEFTGAAPQSEHKDVNINNVIDMAVTITNNLIKNSTDRFYVEYGENLPRIKGIRQQLEQVIINLITNACQSLEIRSQFVSIKSGYNSEKKHVYVLVSDQGRGIKESDLKYILDPFFTTKRDSGGTGLGLSISYNIIKNHHGDLIFDTTRGKGTNVTVVFPIENGEPNNE